MAPRRAPRAALLVPLLLVALVAGSCGSDDATAPDAPVAEATLAGVVREPPLEVGGVSLPDATQGGAPMQMRADDGEVLLVYFGYTSCPDVCPMTMSDIDVALDDLDDGLADRVTVAMVTVDPERDRGDLLDRYLGHFFDRSAALRTEDPDELAAAAKAFGVQYEVEDHAPGEAVYDVAHSAITYVVDDTGTVVVEWPFGFASEHMAADLTTLLTPQERA